MEWLKKIIQKLLKKNEIKLIEQHKDIEKLKNDFILDLRQYADFECDDRNGYKIIQNIRLKDMI